MFRRAKPPDLPELLPGPNLPSASTTARGPHMPTITFDGRPTPWTSRDAVIDFNGKFETWNRAISAASRISDAYVARHNRPSSPYIADMYEEAVKLFSRYIILLVTDHGGDPGDNSSLSQASRAVWDAACISGNPPNIR